MSVLSGVWTGAKIDAAPNSIPQCKGNAWVPASAGMTV